MKRLTEEIRISNLKQKHGEKFIYPDGVNVKNSHEKFRIICDKGHIFFRSYDSQMRKKYCPFCSNGIRITGEERLKQCLNIHGNKYKYPDGLNVKNSKTKIKIICDKGHVFYQPLDSHINKKTGCPKCAGLKPLTEKEKIFNATQKHGNKYTYPNGMNVKNQYVKIKIICDKGHVFYQSYDGHVNAGKGCARCAGKKNLNEKERIENIRSVHGFKYKYPDGLKINNGKDKVKIMCPNGHVFYQSYFSHVNQKCGCPFCLESKGEARIKEFLEKNEIIFEKEKRIKECFDKKVLPFDFYIPKINTLIEYQGEQHYHPINFFGGEKGYKSLTRRDKIKKEWAINNGFIFLEIPYYELNNIEEILKSKIRGKHESS